MDYDYIIIGAGSAGCGAAAANPMCWQYLALILDHDDDVDPKDPPRILTNFFATDADCALMRRSIRIGREVAGQRANVPLPTGAR